MDKPAVVTYLRIYHGVMLFIYLCSLCCMGMIGYMSYLDSANSYSRYSSGSEEAVMYLIIMLACILPFAAIYLIGLVIAGIPSKANWVFQLILVAFGLTSMITIIPAILLIISLAMEENRAYYFGEYESL